MTAFRPDIAVVDQAKLINEPLWSEPSILTLGRSIKFVAEVVSSFPKLKLTTEQVLKAGR